MAIYYQEDLLTPDLLYPLIGRSIRKLRQQNGITQERLAELIGADQKQISQIESGKARTRLPTYLLIANVFHVSIDDFLTDALHIDEATNAASILHGEGERKLLGDVVRAVIHYLGEK